MKRFNATEFCIKWRIARNITDRLDVGEDVDYGLHRGAAGRPQVAQEQMLEWSWTTISQCHTYRLSALDVFNVFIISNVLKFSMNIDTLQSLASSCDGSEWNWMWGNCEATLSTALRTFRSLFELILGYSDTISESPQKFGMSVLLFFISIDL